MALGLKAILLVFPAPFPVQTAVKPQDAAAQLRKLIPQHVALTPEITRWLEGYSGFE